MMFFRASSLGAVHRVLWLALSLCLGLWLSCARAQSNTAQPGEVVVVLNSGEGTVSLIDRASRKEIKRYPVGKEPHHLITTLDDAELVVANAASNDLVFIDPTKGDIKRRLPRISDPYQLGYSSDGKWFVSVSLRLNRVDIYAMPNYELKARLATPKAPSHVSFSADAAFAYITLQDSNEILAIDLSKSAIAWKIPVGKTPAGIWTAPDGSVWVGIMGEDFVQVIDPTTRQTVKKIHTGRGAHNIFPMGDGKHVLVSNRVDNTISVVDYRSHAIAHSIKVGGGPDCIEVSADGKEAWVTLRWAAKVAVVDLEARNVVKEIPVGRSPHGIYFRSHAARK